MSHSVSSLAVQTARRSEPPARFPISEKARPLHDMRPHRNFVLRPPRESIRLEAVMGRLLLTTAMIGFLASAAQAQTWGPGPSALPAGAQAAVISGDPGKAGPFVMRLK